jgi:hypothetical protein
VRSAHGIERTRDFTRTIRKLVLYSGTNRYGPRDPDRGGDGWVKPSVGALVQAMGADYLWSDFSNMHGGSFYPPHKSHQQGNDVDGRFADGSIERDWDALKHHTARTAQRFLDVLNGPEGSRIVCMGITFEQKASDPFWTKIKDVTLRDGRKARDVILTWHGHDKHFHMRAADSADKPYNVCVKHLRADGVP